MESEERGLAAEEQEPSEGVPHQGRLGGKALEVARWTFSFAALSSLFRLWGHYIHEHVSQVPRLRKGRGVWIHPTASFRNGQNISLGDYSHVNRNCCLWAGSDSRIVLGSHVLMGPGVCIHATNHSADAGRPMMLQPLQAADVVIEDDVWLGANVVVLAGVTLHQGAIVGAGAVVTRDVPRNTLVAGVPAKPIKGRGTGTIP